MGTEEIATISASFFNQVEKHTSKVDRDQLLQAYKAFKTLSQAKAPENN